jgi:hypothetical protein
MEAATYPFDPLWMSALATAVSVAVTIVLVIITWFYMREARRISIETQRPSLGIEPADFYFGDFPNFGSLKLRNTGALAKNLKVDMIDNKKNTERLYVPSLAHNMSVKLSLNIKEEDKSSAVLSVNVLYQDASNKKLSVQFVLDFAALKAEERQIIHQSDPLDEISNKIGHLESEVRRLTTKRFLTT